MIEQKQTKTTKELQEGGAGKEEEKTGKWTTKDTKGTKKKENNYDTPRSEDNPEEKE